MVLCEMSFDRCEELLVGAACELRPAFAVSDPTLLFTDRAHLA